MNAGTHDEAEEFYAAPCSDSRGLRNRLFLCRKLVRIVFVKIHWANTGIRSVLWSGYAKMSNDKARWS